MTIADTSIARFNQLCLSKGITKLDERVLAAFKYGVVPGHPATAIRTRREAAAFLHDEASTVAGAVNRLLRRGKLRVTGKIMCFITHNKVESITVCDSE